MQRAECDFDGHGRWHLFVEYWCYNGSNNSKPDCYHYLYSNGYQRGRVYFNRQYHGKRECPTHG